MKHYLLIPAVAALLVCACTPEKPAELSIPKNTVEFAGNAFSFFSLGGDVKLYTVQNPENSSEWTVQAVVPVRKEMSGALEDLAIDLVPLDEHGVRVRDGFVLDAEDLQNLLPVYNADVNVERSIVFSISDEDKKYLPANEAAKIIESAKGVRMNFNVPQPNIVDKVAETAAAIASSVAAAVTPSTAPSAPAPAAAPAAPKAPKEYPMTIDGLCRKHGVYGLLDRYESALRNGDRRGAKRIEDQLWAIEKRIKKDSSIPESLRSSFVRYVENKEDEIEDRY